MWLLDHTCATPAENLALDEALLDETEAGRLDEGLRFWESPVHFVVLGLSQTVDGHVHREACIADSIPILRRCSAGGCVLQGPGCLNYSLVLRTARPGCESITASYRTILGKVASALGELGRPVLPAGISDLALEDRKVSGSAQRRRHRYFLHHGTLLLNFNLPLCTRYLREPEDQPDYRDLRRHEAFVENLSLCVSSTKKSVSNVFHVSETLEFNAQLIRETARLTQQKYTDSGWNYRR